MKNIGIINTAAGNIHSLIASIRRLNYRPLVLDRPQDISDAITTLVIPGQGHFGAVMNRLHAFGWPDFLHQWCKENKMLFGICVGMQVLFESSEESPGTQGLAFFKGRATKLQSPKQPMVGWASIHSDTLPPGDAYFVNSYAIKQAEECIAKTTYGETFCAAVKAGSLVACQFHPEKSGTYGQEVMQQCLS